MKFLNSKKAIKIVGIVATAIGMGATLVSNWVSEKQTDEKIDDKIAKKFSEVLSEKN